ncbi:acyl-CoA dehydrogenase family protein [Zavarzinia sp. CC-PAN008]|uniref:acyl-CoA dehydrogenase family protein n=1 Tax=Zavarzinia sp. CC-PAN008 TaxID=3243332 RepID=UPI003F742018
MNFEFSEDQEMLREQARRFLADRSSTKVVRRILESDAPFDADLWKGIVEMGWTGTAIPEEFGGLGLGHLELCVIAEELGRALAPVPFASSVYLATEALLLAGTNEQKQAWLPKLAAGEAIGTVAVAEGPTQPTARNIAATFENGKLSGTKVPVPDGDIADFAIVLARAGAEGERGLVLALVDLKGPGVARKAVKTIDPTRSQAEITFTDAPAEAVGAVGEGWANLTQVQDRAAVLIAFEQVGGAQVALEMAKDYALQRYAFGRAIASFQAIKHKLADVYVAIELARSNAYYGAWALSAGSPELPVAAAGARVAATEAFHQASKESIQTHGGMGYTWEGDCHLYYRRSKHLGLKLGSARTWKEHLISRLEARNAA